MSDLKLNSIPAPSFAEPDVFEIFSTLSEDTPDEDLSGLCRSLAFCEESHLNVYGTALSQSGAKQEATAADLEIFAEALEKFSTAAEVREGLNIEASKVDRCLQKNVSAYYKAAKKARQVSYSLVTAYEIPEKNVQILMVDRHFGTTKSASTAVLDQQLKHYWAKFKLDHQKAPSHVSFSTPVPASYWQTLASLARSVQAQVILPLPSLKTGQQVIQYMGVTKLTNPGSADSAYLTTTASYGYLDQVTDNGQPDGNPLEVPVTASMAALFAKLPAGTNCFGLFGKGLRFRGTQLSFLQEMPEVAALDKLGVNTMIEDGELMGACTMYTGPTADYRNQPAFSLFANIQRALSLFARRSIYTDWDLEKQAAYLAALLLYFSSLNPRLSKPVGINDIIVNYDKTTGLVSTKIKLSFKGIQRAYSFQVVSDDTGSVTVS